MRLFHESLLGEPHTGDFMAKVMKDALAQVKDLGAIVCGIVMDNASNMENMRDKFVGPPFCRNAFDPYHSPFFLKTKKHGF